MPVQVTYPGVYIQELPSGRHTITGVATSITAFVGRALYGPVEEPITIFSFGDYQRFFGGLAYDFPMSYAVQDFFLNGGSQAVIVRLFEPKTTLKEWTDNAAIAATEVKTAADNADNSNNATAQSVVTAVQKVADTYQDEPGKTVAQSLLKIASDAAGKSGATADSVKTAIDNAITNNTYETPPYPTATLTLKVYGPAVAPIKAALTPIQAAIDALFGDDGKEEASGLTVSKLITAATNAANSVSGSDNKKIAQQVAAEVKGDNIKTALDAAIQALIRNDILTKIAPYPEVQTALKTILTGSSGSGNNSSASGFQAALDIFGTDGNKFDPTKAAVNNLSTELQYINNQFIKNAAT
ncbi:MAG: hypothetical protein IM466_07985, partial [Microcystis sp. M04BS1]|nr:hypothetical protein [Microcystis sp. M04BS1]